VHPQDATYHPREKKSPGRIFRKVGKSAETRDSTHAIEWKHVITSSRVESTRKSPQDFEISTALALLFVNNVLLAGVIRPWRGFAMQLNLPLVGIVHQSGEKRSLLVFVPQ
jgi:hypothetical protein